MYYCVYKTTNLHNQKYYYGAHSTDNLMDDYLGSGMLIKQAITKYGLSNFKKEIVSTFESAEDMFEFEEFVISHVLGQSDCYNLNTGGVGFASGEHNPQFGRENGVRFGPHSDETKLKISTNRKGKVGIPSGWKHSDETKSKMNKTHKFSKRKPMSDETKLKIAMAQRLRKEVK